MNPEKFLHNSTFSVKLCHIAGHTLLTGLQVKTSVAAS